MPWSNQSGGGDGGQGPWGGGGGRGPGGPGGQPPDIEEMLRKGQERVKNIIPGGGASPKIIIVILALVVAAWLGSGFYRVQADEKGVALIFGAVWDETAPGLHYNLPAPIGEVVTPKVTRVNRVEVGFRSPTQSSRGSVKKISQESLQLTGDENIIDVQFVVFWQIKNARDFLFNIRNPEFTVKAAAESAIRETIGKSDFEFVRTTGRGKITAETQKLIQQILDDYRSGILVRQVEVQDVDPPEAVIDAFKDVAAAKQDAERAENEAQAYLNEVVQRAEGQAAQILASAQAYRQEQIDKASGETERFLSVYREYLADKSVTRRRMYLETMEEVLQRMDKVLLEESGSGTGVVPYLPLDQLRPGRARQDSGNQNTGETR